MHPGADDEIGAALQCGQGGLEGVEPVGQVGVREQDVGAGALGVGPTDRVSLAPVALVAQDAELSVPTLRGEQRGAGFFVAAVIDDEELEDHAASATMAHDARDDVRETAAAVIGGNDDRETHRTPDPR